MINAAQSLMNAYAPVVVFIGLALVMGVAPLALGALFRPNAPDAQKRSTYECGFEPFEAPRSPFDVRFYLVAILFIIFDLETAFLFPWAASFRSLGMLGCAAMAFFLGLLILGFAYEWRKGALEWE